MTPGGKLSEQRRDYLYRLVSERLQMESTDDPIHVEWVERGKAYEPYAAAQFEFLENCKLEQIGFVTDDGGRLGCSPDRLIVGKNEAVEIKCPSPPVHMGRLLDGLDTKYKPQVQMQLLVGGFDRVHFYSYHDRMPPFKIVTKKDVAFQKIMRQHLYDFCDELDDATEKASRLGSYSPNPTVETPHGRTAPGRDPDAVSNQLSTSLEHTCSVMM